jgi:tetratricopeptide (TPR) repeat protein
MSNDRTKTVRARGPVGPTDRTLNRLIVALVAVIAIGVPAIAIIYWADRHVEGGGSMTQRTIDAAEAAVRAEPNKLSVRIVLAAAYAAAGRSDDAVSQYSVVLTAEGGNTVALLGRGDVLRQAGRLDEARSDYQALVDIASKAETAGADRQLEAAYYGLGVIDLEQDRPREAATHLANAVRINRADADALNALGTALIALNDLPNAIEALRDAVALVPTGWAEPYQQLDQAYAAQGDADGAAYARGMAALCEGRAGDALDLLRPLTGGPYARDALVGLALTAEQMSDTATAADLYAQVYALDPTDFAAITGLNRLGVALTTPQPTSGEP